MEERLYPQRWLILAVLFVVVSILQFAVIITPGIATIFIPEYGFTPAQFGIVCNMPFLAGVLFGIPCGSLGDRYGTRKVMLVGLFVFVAGALWRVFASDFISLCISSLVMGFALATLNSNSTKVIRLWFPGKAMGPAMGVYVCGASLGAGVALKIGPSFANSAAAFMACVYAAIASLLIWLLFFRTHPDGERCEEESSLQQMKAVMKDKNVWLISVMIFFIFGCSTTAQTYMNAGLAEHGSGNIGLASTISASSAVFVAIGSIFMPALIAKFNKLRPVMLMLCIAQFLVLCLIFVLPFGIPTLILMFFMGLFLGGMLAMGKAIPALLPNINPRDLGAVGGVQSTFQNIGAWFVAGYIIAPICQVVIPGNIYFGIYVGAGICALLAGLTVMMLPEMPTSVDAKMKLETAKASVSADA
ncbi:MAG: MFS transporter [Thermacetogeniaceae bacterium]|jgi:nitrate/nitrite transporter NarK|nr:MFS transporter [Thermoanaerobacterales bacterium]NLN20550.1 MFS transporter [Syntrophomonadaceae bacterium]